MVTTDAYWLPWLPSEKPRASTDWSWKDITTTQIPDSCGRACNTSLISSRGKAGSQSASCNTLPDEPNELYAGFDTFNTNQHGGILSAEAAQSSLRVCSSELADVFTDIFNLSVTQSAVPTCFKSATIVPFPQEKQHNLLEWLLPHRTHFSCALRG